MDAIERLLKALAHQTVDRPPVVGVNTSVTVELMDAVGVKWPDAHHDPLAMVRLSAAAYEICGLESLKIPFDMTVEAGALGAGINFGTVDTLPQVKGPAMADPAELEVSDSIFRKGRFPLVFTAIQTARRRYGEQIPIVTSIVGPFTLAAMLFGFDNLFCWMLAEPEVYHDLLEKITRLCIGYAELQHQAGGHVVQVGEASASGDLISAGQYGQFVAPYHEKLCRSLRFPTVIHICGNITGHLKYIAGTGMRGISFDHRTDIDEARKWLKGKVALIGYVPTDLLRNGTPEEVFAFAENCLQNQVDVLNAGCAWPPHAPTRNLAAMIQSVAVKEEKPGR